MVHVLHLVSNSKYTKNLCLQGMSQQKYKLFTPEKKKNDKNEQHHLPLENILMPDSKTPTTAQYTTQVLTLRGKEVRYKWQTTLIQFQYYRANYSLIQWQILQSRINQHVKISIFAYVEFERMNFSAGQWNSETMVELISLKTHLRK